MDSDSEKITTLDELRIAAEDAAEKVIFKHAHLISEDVQRKIWARGLPYTVLQGNEIVELYPDGTRKVVAHHEGNRIEIAQKRTTLKS